MSQYRNVGPEQRDQVNPQRTWYDMRRGGQKLADVLRTPQGSMLPMFAMAVFGFLFPAMADIFLISGLGLAAFIRSAQKSYTLPAKMPRHSNIIDPMETNPAGKAGPARGTFYLGNDRTSGEEVWLTNRDAGVHMLVLGTTGSGKAQPLWASILTPSGWTRMGDLKLGDFVSTPDGGSARVSGIFPQGKLNINTILAGDGRTAWACDQHLWSARINGVISTVRTLDLASAIQLGQAVEIPFVDQSGKMSGWVSIARIDANGVEDAQCIMVDHPDHLYITDGHLVTHNTEMLLGICQNALNHGSGFMFVDGKAQDKIAFKIMDLVRARGRDDDFLCLNFMTGAKDIIGAQAHKITHTMNPFAYGSSGMIAQIVVGLMSGGGGGNDMWADRAISFVEGLSPPLVYLRDNFGVILDVNEYRKYFELEKIEDLTWNGGTKYPGLDQVLDPLKNYLINLPGYDRNKFGRKGGQGDDTKLQHGYITMQLSRAFTSLADTYGHIVRVPLGEVFFPDLVKNRRILVVMLPSLEKTPSETANIGKIIVTALRNIMSEGLGARLEGDRDELDNDEGKNLLPPYVVILDEYGYYAVKGFAVAFAQARSLGFVCIVGGQDLASFQKESKEEAVSICGNTRIKAFGSIEDPDQTMDFVVKSAGKTTVARTQGYDAELETFGMNYSDQMSVNFEQIDRVNPSDVKEQTEGQFHFVWRSRVIRAATYYVNPKRVKKVRLNHFVQVRAPDQLQMDEIAMSSSGLAERIANMDILSIETPQVREITAAAQAIKVYHDLGPIERSIATIVHVGQTRESHIEKFRAAVRGQSHDDETPDSYRRLAEIDLSAGFKEPVSSRSSRVEDSEDMLPDPMDILAEGRNDRGPGYRSMDEEIPISMGSREGQNFEDVQPQSMNVFVPTRKNTGFGADVFSQDTDRAKRLEAALTEPDDAAPLLDYDVTVKGVQSLEIAMGATQEQAQEHAKQVVKGIEDATRYPLSVPKEKTGEQVTDMLQDLLSALEE